MIYANSFYDLPSSVQATLPTSQANTSSSAVQDAGQSVRAAAFQATSQSAEAIAVPVRAAAPSSARDTFQPVRPSSPSVQASLNGFTPLVNPRLPSSSTPALAVVRPFIPPVAGPSAPTGLAGRPTAFSSSETSAAISARPQQQQRPPPRPGVRDSGDLLADLLGLLPGIPLPPPPPPSSTNKNPLPLAPTNKIPRSAVAAAPIGRLPTSWPTKSTPEFR
jgi:hypothetical protein